jgi:hypothetical protein
LYCIVEDIIDAVTVGLEPNECVEARIVVGNRRAQQRITVRGGDDAMDAKTDVLTKFVAATWKADPTNYRHGKNARP